MLSFLHPIVIHFPIALLTIYAILELVRFRKILEKPYWFYIKASLIIAGSVGALVGVITGAIASGWIIGGSRIFALHQIFGLSTLVLSVISAKAYGWEWFIGPGNGFSKFVLQPKIIVILAFLILVCITITGGIGGAMIRGTQFDPLMAPIFKLLGIY
ncbi:MAG: DUF2231 domain-containing protein [Minisyncoccota bacterium]